jgi:hypothetical protein
MNVFIAIAGNADPLTGCKKRPGRAGPSLSSLTRSQARYHIGCVMVKAPRMSPAFSTVRFLPLRSRFAEIIPRVRKFFSIATGSSASAITAVS